MAQYPFGAEFEKRLFAVVLRDSEFLKRRGDIVKAEYFTHNYCKLSMSLVDDFYGRYKSAPSEVAFQELVRQEFAKHPPSKDVKATWDAFLQELWSLPTRDMKYIEDQAVRWAQEQAWRKLIEDGAKRIDEGRRTGRVNFDDFSERLREAQIVGVERPDPTSDYLGSTMQRLGRYWDLGKDKISCGVGFRELDKCLGGGLERGELGVIAAPTSRGKTAALVQVGCVGGMMAGQRILAVSLELSSFNFQKRIDKCIAMMPDHTVRDRVGIREEPDELLERLEFLKQFKPDLRVLEFAALTVGVDDIEKRLELYKSQDGWIPTMLVVDYATLIKPPEKRDQIRNEIEAIVLHLRSLARTWNMAVWTAAQTNRGSFTKTVITTADIGECIGISQHSDVMFTICQTGEEEKENRCRFFVAKNREGEAKKIVHLTYDKYINRFEEAEAPVEEAKVEGEGKTNGK